MHPAAGLSQPPAVPALPQALSCSAAGSLPAGLPPAPAWRPPPKLPTGPALLPALLGGALGMLSNPSGCGCLRTGPLPPALLCCTAS